LDKKHRPRGVELDGKGCNGKKRYYNRQRYEGSNKIKYSLDEQFLVILGNRLHGQKRNAPNFG
jgi:hypothetical protein